MLDNIIGHTDTVGMLREELTAGNLPRASLFHGPLYSAKLSTALEIARVLICENGAGEWTCGCPACRRSRLLSHPDTLILGPSYFDVEIPAAADVFRRTRKRASRYLFIRSVRKLLKRFDAVLWEDRENRIRPALQIAAEIDELSDSLSPEGASSENDDLHGKLDDIVSRCQTLSRSVPDNVPIDQVRNVSYWVHLSSMSGKKSVIIESADRMQESSRNALLKLLEEPPEKAYFFLLTTRRSLIMPTIRSRLRAFSFPQRSPTVERKVLQIIFHEKSEEYRSLRDYFLAWNDIDHKELARQARVFFDSVLSLGDGSASPRRDNGGAPLGESSPRVGSPRGAAAGGPPPELIKLMRGPAAAGTLASFLEELVFLLRSGLRQGYRDVEQFPLDTLERWSNLLQGGMVNMNSLKLSPQLILEDLFYRMREAL